MLNPGCISKKMSDYKPRITSVLYHHPNIVHYVMFSTTPRYQLIFRDYMSMLSVYKFLKPEKIILHTNTDIVGAYWKSMQEWKDSTVEINKVKRVPKLANVEVKYIEHEADYTKIKILCKYGGSIFDFDVIMVNGTKWKQNQKISECVLSLERNNLNIGALSCRKGSSFAQAWLYKYHNDYKQEWTYNSGLVPANILRMLDTNDTCHNVYVDETLAQDPLYNQVKRWVDSSHSVNWKEKAAAHYYYAMLPKFSQLKKEDLDERLLMQDSSLGDLFRHVSNTF